MMATGWTTAALGEGLLRDIQPGFASGANNRTGQGIAHLRPMNVSTSGRIAMGDIKYVPQDRITSNARLLQPGDVLFNNTNSPALVGKTAFYESGPMVGFSNHMTRLRPHEEVLVPAFLALTLHQRWRDGYFESVCNNHVSQASVGRTALLATDIPVPPLPEQRRIVAAVTQIDERIEVTETRLTRMAQQFTSLRRACLSAACVGRLTEHWRSREDSDPAVDLAAMADEVQASRGRRYFYPADVLPQEPADLPAGWAWASMDEVAVSITDGDHQAPPKAAAGVPFVTISKISGGRLDLDDTMFVPEEYYANLSEERKARRGDILYSVTGSLGIPLLVEDDNAFAFQRHIALVRSHPLMSSNYVRYALESSLLFAQAKRVATGIAQLTVPLKGLRAMRLPVPPRPEQDEIVRRIDVVLGQTATIEALVAETADRCARLRHAVVAKALRGELVPNEMERAELAGEHVESAAKVLDRLQAEIL